MKRGERWVLILIGVLIAGGVARSLLVKEEKHDHEIPFYSTASPQLASEAMDIYHKNGCKSCHTLWTLSDLMQRVPAPMLDGIGSLHNEEWLYNYLSSANPQGILPSRLKQEYRMPSYASMPENERHTLAAYLASLKVKDWYLEQTKQSEYEKLTGLEARK